MNLNPPPTLTTARLVIRPFCAADAHAVFRYACNPNVTRFTAWDYHRSIADAEHFVGPYAAMRYHEGQLEPLALCSRDNPADVIGAIGAFWGSREDGCIELGYWIAEPFWGRGLAVEASVALIDHVFTREPVERLQARCIAGNTASARVLEKLGLKLEGTLRRATLHRGVHKDVLLYSMIRPEWVKERLVRM